MRAELIFLGRRVDMASRTHRRAMVVLIYLGLGLLMGAFWRIDHWRHTGVYMIFATIIINRLLLGGYNWGGLVKPFNGRAPLYAGAPPLLMLKLMIYGPRFDNSDYRNDEREMQQRDRAHYWAYQAIYVALCLLWLLAWDNTDKAKWLGWDPVIYNMAIYGVALAAIVIAVTLPQALLLWTEPDMAELDTDQ